MNVIEIEEAVSELFAQPFDRYAFPFAFLEAYGNKRATIDKLKKGDSNKSDFEHGVLQKNNIHIVTCERGHTSETLQKLRESPVNQKFKVKFIFVTDGVELHAEDINSGDILTCEYQDLPSNFSFFLSLFGFFSLAKVKESSFDIRATSRFNRLYVQLLKDNPQWRVLSRRADMNHFMAGLIFCFFAEDTGIFLEGNLFTETVNKMSDSSSSNTHEVISEIFRAMNTPYHERSVAGVRKWADKFPYVNGGVFSGRYGSPVFSRIARSYLISIGSLDWQQVNPDIFGSMIQAVADDEERQSLGLHYTSVPSILKVLNPLFLDELRERLEKAGDSSIKLLNLRKRLAKIRVFDPACGSGNFLVIAYKQLRAIESEINIKRNEAERPSVIPLTNFRGIEIKDFSAQIARLSLIIAEFQCDTLYRGQRDALTEFLPLDSNNWITCGNALRLDWEGICPPTGEDVSLRGTDLFDAPLDQSEIVFENEGGETYICSNPPYSGAGRRTEDQKADMELVFGNSKKPWKALDYVACWYMKAAYFGRHSGVSAAFVATNSICQGRQVEALWTELLTLGYEIDFCHTSFKWSNLASHNAGVTVVITSITTNPKRDRRIFTEGENGEILVQRCSNINPYLVSGSNVIVQGSANPLNILPKMNAGNKPNDGGGLLMSLSESESAVNQYGVNRRLVRPFLGADEFITGRERRCLWIEDDEYEDAKNNPWLSARFELVERHRSTSKRAGTNKGARTPHRFGEVIGQGKNGGTTITPRHTSERREYLPVGFLTPDSVISDAATAIYDSPIWCVAVIASKLHLAWIAATCGKIKTDFRYSSALGWHTFPIPKLTEKNKMDLSRSAENILIAREAHFPATIAELYDPDKMPDNLRQAHEHNDDVLERIYIGRHFKNDTERLEKLFEMYVEMTKNP